MTKTIRGGAPCSIARTVDVLKDPWSFMVLREALDGVTRFADFRAGLGIASDILTERLTALVEAGVLTREQYQEPGSRARHSYHLTAAGTELAVVIGALQQWGDEHLPWQAGPTIERRSARTGRPLHVAFVDDRGREVPLEQVSFRRTASYPAR
ncbi:helix-turn-helix domain-containing protein [Jatrophihabitans sp.]|uniref:winged helix-turn-helix transcriptional regulator n=1 Tax=Jatrophihabitans sp. TaxID=1932789 RepID=UPI0030C666A4